MTMAHTCKQVKDEVALSSQTEDGLHSASRPKARSVVAWITGLDAVHMERASDEEFKQEMAALMDSFPSLHFPRSFQVSSWLQQEVSAVVLEETASSIQGNRLSGLVAVLQDKHSRLLSRLQDKILVYAMYPKT